MKIISYLKQFLHFFNLSHELEKQETIHTEIQKGVIFKGTNLWILVFAILVASIGLNMNSTAVIIGAMLISPLMGPITGMGYSIAIYDGTLFSKSLKNFSFAVITSLLTSTLYFTLSPIATAHSELLARTSPTIYDVLIALFGGVAGIVALSSKQKGNVLPGVAIATALMPPLCTAGYGLATAQFHFFFGAFYLFLINTIFIALAATWISKLFKFPISNVVEPKKKTKINRWLTFIISLILIPSIYFGYQLVKEERFKQNAEKFIDNVSFYEGSFLLKNEIKADQKWIKLVYAGNELSDQQKHEITQKLSDFDLKGDLIIQQGFSLNVDDSQNKEIYRLKEQLNKMNDLLHQKQQQLDSLQQNVIIGQSLVNEISVFFPNVRSCIVAHSKKYKPNSTESIPQTIVVLELKSEISTTDKEKIKKWLVERMKTDQIELIFK
jgi:uncharacterized hydrophobic protein (TIGR00271 family)